MKSFLTAITLLGCTFMVCTAWVRCLEIECEATLKSIELQQQQGGSFQIFQLDPGTLQPHKLDGEEPERKPFEPGGREAE